MLTARSRQARAAAVSRHLRQQGAWSVRYADDTSVAAPLRVSSTADGQVIVTMSDTADRGVEWVTATRGEVTDLLKGHGYEVRSVTTGGLTQTLAATRPGWSDS